MLLLEGAGSSEADGKEDKAPTAPWEVRHSLCAEHPAHCPVQGLAWHCLCMGVIKARV